ncbi:NDR1/HIN1-like protein 13 [Tasmannia lanceolata]|uniref:NDR1/HIN1-like protein 13 n=1 Tax=Tasmannia lanceolata TaxID=3420 RepID=UPI004064C5D1
MHKLLLFSSYTCSTSISSPPLPHLSMAEWVLPPDDKPDSSPEPAPHRSGTYVVQVPKDQIYRFPPPENAVLAERYRIPIRSKNPCCHCLSWLFGVIGVLIFLLVVSGAIFYIVVNPRLPRYQIHHVHVKNTPTLHKHHPKPEYQITITSENPNARMDFSYLKGGSATLSYKHQQHIAKGKPPKFDQGYRDSTEFQLALTGSDVGLPHDVEKSLKNEQSKIHIPLSLSLDLPVRIKVSALRSWNMNMAVRCDMVASSLAKDAHIVSQMCQSKLKP